MRETALGCHGDLNRTERTGNGSRPVTLRGMTVRSALTGAGAIGAVITVYPAVTAIAGTPPRIAIAAMLVVAVGVVVSVAVSGRSAAFRGDGHVRARPDTGIVDCTGAGLRTGDTVRADAGFDGPMELAFGRGVIVKVGRGKAHVRFNDIPEQVHPVTPATLRRLA